MSTWAQNDRALDRAYTLYMYRIFSSSGFLFCASFVIFFLFFQRLGNAFKQFNRLLNRKTARKGSQKKCEQSVLPQHEHAGDDEHSVEAGQGAEDEVGRALHLGPGKDGNADAVPDEANDPDDV